MIPATLCLLAILDGAFAGFRAAAGRDLRIHKRGLFIRAMLVGAAAGAAAMAVEGALVTALTALAPEGSLAAPFARAGALMLAWYAPFAAVVLCALGAYITLAYEARSLATVIVLGPLTLARPWLVVAGAAHASLREPRAAPVALAGAALVLLAGRLLDHRFGRPRGVRSSTG